MMVAHDRYLIYEMLGKNVRVERSGMGGPKVEGFVDKVFRDIFDNVVVITVDGVSRKFKEPDAIVRQGKDVLFVYGDISVQDEDEELFSALRDSYENIYDVIERTTPRPRKTLLFVVTDSTTKRRKLRRDTFHR